MSFSPSEEARISELQRQFALSAKLDVNREHMTLDGGNYIANFRSTLPLPFPLSLIVGFEWIIQGCGEKQSCYCAGVSASGSVEEQIHRVARKIAEDVVSGNVLGERDVPWADKIEPIRLTLTP
jgi:hypothetical protein